MFLIFVCTTSLSLDKHLRTTPISVSVQSLMHRCSHYTIAEKHNMMKRYLSRSVSNNMVGVFALFESFNSKLHKALVGLCCFQVFTRKDESHT